LKLCKKSFSVLRSQGQSPSLSSTISIILMVYLTHLIFILYVALGRIQSPFFSYLVSQHPKHHPLNKSFLPKQISKRASVCLMEPCMNVNLSLSSPLWSTSLFLSKHYMLLQ
jgi:hypothetical protein